jgi:hypothetical protein
MEGNENQTEPGETHDKTTRWVLFYFSLIFIAAGVWIAVDGDDFHDRMMGGVSILLFAVCAVTLGYMIKTKRY